MEQKEMVKKSEEDKLIELEKKIKQMQAKKQQLATIVKQKERKARTKRLIEVGAIFESYFEIEGKDQAETIAKKIQATVKAQKGKWLNEKKDIYKPKDESVLIKEKQKG
ncbi:hypothetical protein [Sporolactobacillus laevolacticus]|uniref:DUF3847 domain-containing protein n=1 Tax=Sporolactobacillus laevolacticus DSM 442 TaxID=1395513 RepID=V6ITV4_9BACL|nr:hypothetical protein [Sporolactobacillus laevolacticus]EST10240.1 hypothetical protein P343_18255 [Sporolactobacillus laevolacticus DSM 442]